MTLTLRNSVGVSFAFHVSLLAVFGWYMAAFAPRLPRITEITLVSGGSSGGGAVVAGTQVSGGRAVRAVHGSVSVASPDFVSVGRKPRRSGDALMGAETGAAAAGNIGTGEGAAAGGAGRKIRYQEPLEYPDWAKEQAVDGKVTLLFKVLPGGEVDSQIVVKRTSGWRQLDELAIRTLRNYLFEPLSAESAQIPQWGELTFHFKPE